MIRLVILNPMSGKANGLKLEKGIIKTFTNLSKEGKIKEDKVIIEKTKCIGDATVILNDYINRYDDEIVAYIVGGDGTLSEVAQAAKKSKKVSIVVIPRGTGNDFSRLVNSYKSIRKIIRNSIDKEKCEVDTIDISKYTSMNVINAGFDAAIADNMNLFRKWPLISGSMKYKLAIFYTLFSSKKYRFKIRVDNKIYKGAYTLIAIGNGKYYGGGIKVLPQAEINDGFLDICIIDSTTLLQKLKFLPKFSKGRHVGLDIVHMERGKEVTVVSNKKFPVSIDGEIITTNRFKAKVNTNSINVIKTLDKSHKIL